MSESRRPENRRAVASVADLARLLEALRQRGYALFGPTIVDGTIVQDEIEGLSDLPRGWSDEQDGGSYRLVPRTDGRYFAYVLGAQGCKRSLHPPAETLWCARRIGNRVDLHDEPCDAPSRAHFGVRPCEVAALRILDRVFVDGPTLDQRYAQRRRATFIFAVNCTHPGGTCFCASMSTGPEAAGDYDIAITEVLDERGHRFVVRVGSQSAVDLLAEVSLQDATEHDLRAESHAMERATKHMGRHLDTTDLKNLLYRNVASAWWDDVASRCLACGNCTMVCPTWFCGTVLDTTSLGGESAVRARHWDLGFGLDFSYIHGGPVRQSVQSRYRQWLTHKLASWVDQFGSFGCVGCGPCITWCHVGIDLTAEARGIREHDVAEITQR